LDEWPEDTDLPLTLQEQKPHFYRQNRPNPFIK